MANPALRTSACRLVIADSLARLVAGFAGCTVLS